MVEELKKNAETFPYPHVWHNTCQLGEFTAKYASQCSEQNKWLENEEHSLSGRITNIRPHGGVIFYDIMGDGTKLQILANKGMHKGKLGF